MLTYSNNAVVSVPTNLLIANNTILAIYSSPKNFEDIKSNILKLGIIQPIVVNQSTMEVVSGNLRLQIARELNYETVPVFYCELSKEELDIVAFSSNKQREKSLLDTKRELDFIEKYFNVSQGSRSDLNPQMREESLRKQDAQSKISKYNKDNLKKANKMAKELYGDGADELVETTLSKIDEGNGSLNSFVKKLEKSVNSKRNSAVVPESYEILLDDFVVFNESSADMFQLEDKTVSSVVTSPPYFAMRDYGNGEFEIGLEKECTKYIQNLITIFNECHRVLKDDGSLFVNINEKVEKGAYRGVVFQFALEMMKNGWSLNDEIIWLKNNAQYTFGKRSVRSHEYIFHFVKSTNKGFYYDETLAERIDDKGGLCVVGSGKDFPKFLSGMDFRDNVLVTNASNTSALRKKCNEKGFNLTHSATFPVEVPGLLVMLTSKPGDIVLDPFNGTGVTGQVALLTGRKYVGYELNPEFVMATEVRVKNMNLFNIPLNQEIKLLM